MMIKLNLTFIVLLYFPLSIISQEQFSNINVSQNSNNFIFRTSQDRIFISSTDGLNIFDGQNIKVYRPSTHNMYGYNVQSNFFEDASGKVWFTTYEALNYYDTRIDDLRFYFMITPNGDTLKENYKAFAFLDNILYLKAGNMLFAYDVIDKRILKSFNVDLSKFHELSGLKLGSSIFVFAGSSFGYKVFNVTKTSADLINKGELNVEAQCISNRQLWVGDGSGNLLLYDFQKNGFVFRDSLSVNGINGICLLGNTRLGVSCYSNELLIYDVINKVIDKKILPHNSITGQPLKQTIIPYLDKDSTLWVGGEGQGVFFHNFSKKKFNHYCKSENCENPVSVTKIIPWTGDKHLLLTRKNGIKLITADGTELYHWSSLPNGLIGFSALSGVKLDDNSLLFTNWGNLYKLNLQTKKIHLLLELNKDSQVQYGQIERLPNDKIVASCYTKQLYEIILHNDLYTLSPYGDLGKDSVATTYFKTDESNNLFVSNDEISVLVCPYDKVNNTHAYSHTLPIAGGVWSISNDKRTKGIYLTNTQGLFYIEPNLKSFHRVTDNNNYLSQTIYSSLRDDDGSIWLGTNTGLLKFYPENSEVKVFSAMDGIQSSEFNSHAYLKTATGHFFFGGVNGLNYFHPSEVKFSEKEAPVYISEFRINDETDPRYPAPQFIKDIRLPFKENTISFDFHAIDFSDPNATRVKYRLVGVDEDYIEFKNPQASVRYPNLEPGNYTLSIFGKNSDGVWNEKPRELSITILTPFYRTWWFLTLSFVAVVLFGYWLVRSYYKRKLQAKNQLLREQSLIIEKQQAVENERTRIASEMHDDLGSGLTTIRYLSDKALKQAKDADEAIQIKRIADHSNTLVRNMSEIIWAMNSRFDNTDNLIGYLRRYASEYLDERQMPFTFEANGATELVSIGGEKRRNIFLIFKELLHNSIKYSKAKSISILIETTDNFSFRISEIGGVGFDPDLSIEKGNGLFNIQKRLKSIDGHIAFDKTDDAMHIIVTVPINITNLA